jgi:hypothetical protein
MMYLAGERHNCPKLIKMFYFAHPWRYPGLLKTHTHF